MGTILDRVWQMVRDRYEALTEEQKTKWSKAITRQTAKELDRRKRLSEEKEKSAK